MAPAVVPIKVRRSIVLVTKLSLTSEHHRNVVLIGGGNHFVVPTRPTGLNDGTNTCFGGLFDSVAEREESVRPKHGSFGAVTRETSLVHRKKRCVDARHLAGTNSNCRSIARDKNCI